MVLLYIGTGITVIVRVHYWVLPTLSVWGRGFVEFSALEVEGLQND